MNFMKSTGIYFIYNKYVYEKDSWRSNADWIVVNLVQETPTDLLLK